MAAQLWVVGRELRLGTDTVALLTPEAWVDATLRYCVEPGVGFVLAGDEMRVKGVTFADAAPEARAGTSLRYPSSSSGAFDMFAEGRT